MMVTGTAKSRTRRDVSFAEQMGWSLMSRRGSGHHALVKGGHTVGVSSTPSDTNWKRQVQRAIKRCEEGRCTCRDEHPASYYNVRKVRTMPVAEKPQIASIRRTEGGRVLTRIASGDTRWDLVFDPDDGDVWTGHLLTGDSIDTTVDVLADIPNEHLVIGNITFEGLPLAELRKQATTGIRSDWVGTRGAATYLKVSPSAITGLVKTKRLVSKEKPRRGKETEIYVPSLDHYLKHKGKRNFPRAPRPPKVLDVVAETMPVSPNAPAPSSSLAPSHIVNRDGGVDTELIAAVAKIEIGILSAPEVVREAVMPEIKILKQKLHDLNLVIE